MKNKFDIVYNLDSRDIAKVLSSDIEIQTTITSPPYFDMKDYGVGNQIGYGQSYYDYLNDLKRIFSDILSKTKEDGSLWIIIDTFKRQNNVVLLPFDLARELQDVGWYLQDIIIWKKDKTVPWSAKGFSQRKFEYVLFFTKGAKFKYNLDSVRVYDTSQLKEWWVKYPERYNPKGKSVDELWEFPIPVQGSWGDKYIRHFCPLPKELVSRIINISTDEGDVVLDPFAGSGTVLSQSSYMRRKYIGFELNNEYISMFKQYLARTYDREVLSYEQSKNNIAQSDFESTILNLRMLKYARLILAVIKKELNDDSVKILVEHCGSSSQKFKLIKARYSIICNDNIFAERIISLIRDKTCKVPFTKFGIEPQFIISRDITSNMSTLYGYTAQNTHQYIKNLNVIDDKVRIISPIRIDVNNH